MNNQQKYAELLIKTGLNVQKDQTVIIRGNVESVDFIRTLTEEAYKAGAKHVIVEYSDLHLDKLKYTYAPEEAFLEFPKYKAEYMEELFKNGACTIRLAGDNPDILKGCDPQKMANANKTARVAMKNANNYTMSNQARWCVAGAATPSWAKKIFPDLDEKQAVEKLWDAIYKTCRVDSENPVKAWEDHQANLKSKCSKLNSLKLEKIHLKSEKTDLEIKLPQGHIWEGGGGKAKDGVDFQANMPTEEVFTAPAKYGVNGTVASTKPLVYNGVLIDNFSLTVKDGKVIDCKAEVGEDTLRKMIETDEGAAYFGEIALVPYSSPISQSGILYYNTLFDENASCHMAVGAGYPECVEGAFGKSDEELDKMQVNTSLIHVDFMIGSSDLNIIGTTAAGQEVQIFKDGEWAI